MFLSGAVKLSSGDKSWWDLSALAYHWYTQPLPTVAAWFMDQLPLAVNKILTLATLLLELFLPFFIFARRYLRQLSAIIFIVFQIIIMITGNYTFFNLLSIALAFTLLDDAFWTKIFPAITSFTNNTNTSYKKSMRRRIIETGLILTVGISGFGETVTLLFGNYGIFPFWNYLEPLRITSTYGLFAIMTTSRLEIIVEGSDDGTNWKPYKFQYKPQDLKQMPIWVAPHQPRLDWQMWFAALGNYQNNQWFVRFVMQLLKGSPDVLSLLAENPFPNKAPKYIRATTYDYSFTDFETLCKTGNWWQSKFIGIYLPPVSLTK